tara:strand:+ start:138 stop:242 length:105 start_codon:yes stop_codon:yes gene_type:complete
MTNIELIEEIFGDIGIELKEEFTELKQYLKENKQ